MSEAFNKFGEAALLYAQNFEVTEQVRETFKSEMAAFLDAVQDRVREIATPDVFCHKVTGQWRYWWLDREENEKYDEHLVVWFWHKKRPEIIWPGTLHLWFGGTTLFKKNRATLGLVASQLPSRVPAYCKLGSNKKDGLEIVIEYGRDDPVHRAAAAVAPLLQVIREAELTLPTAATG